VAAAALALAVFCRLGASASAPQLATGSPGVGDPLAPKTSDELTRSIAFRLGVFDQGDSIDGNPFLDESLTVIEPAVVFDWDVNRDFGYSIKAVYDYRSIKGGGEAVWTPNDGRDASITTSLDVFLDDVDVIRFKGVDEGSESRLSTAASIQWYQVMGPRLHGILGATVAHQDGFLGTPYNGVVVEDGATPPFPFDNDALGTEITEELPDTRTRLALYGRLRQQIVEGTAVELGSRLYSDDWGITSVTFGPRLARVIHQVFEQTSPSRRLVVLCGRGIHSRP